jgi:hypothetical protein
MPFVNSVAGKFGFGHTTADIFGSLRFNSANEQVGEVTMTAIGTSTATVELWFNADSVSIAQRLISTSTVAFVADDFSIRLDGTTIVAGPGAAATNGSTGPGVSSSTPPTAGVWNHVAWVGVSGTSQTLYLNGIRVGTGTAYNLTDPTFRIGGRRISGEFFNGYISNFRYVRGTALYSGASFTVPGRPLYPISGTEFLLKTTYGYTVREDKSINNYTINYTGTSLVDGSTLNPFS